MTVCDVPLLKEIVNSKTQTWSQRKRLLKRLVEGQEAFAAIEAKLVTGAVLTAAETGVYEANTGVDEEKIAWLQSECKQMVDAGRVTVKERDEILASIDTSVVSVTEDMALASAENKPKKVEKLTEKKMALQQRRAAVVASTVVPHIHRLRHSDACVRLRVKLLALAALEDGGRSMSLTLADLKTLEQRGDIEGELKQLEANSKNWFDAVSTVASATAVAVSGVASAGSEGGEGEEFVVLAPREAAVPPRPVTLLPRRLWQAIRGTLCPRNLVHNNYFAFVSCMHFFGCQKWLS